MKSSFIPQIFKFEISVDFRYKEETLEFLALTEASLSRSITAELKNHRR